MPTDPAQGPEPPGILGRLRRALAHAEGAVRCYLALVANEAERRVRGILRDAAWAVILLVLGLLGVILLACGAAAFIQSRLDVPGGGPMAIGAALLATVAILLLIRRGGRPK